MNALVIYFFNLCLLRAKPQDLPDSNALFGVLFVVNVLLGTLIMATTELGLGLGLLESLFELALMLAALRVALYLRGHLGRYVQSATAIMGSSALMSLLALPLLTGAVASGGEGGEGGALLLLGVMVWSVVILGHILRHTFDISPGLGFAVAILYWFASLSLITSLFPIG